MTLLDLIFRKVVASIPTEDKPPSNLASMIKQCEAKGRSDLAKQISDQWERVLAKYPATRVNWGAASSIGGASIKKNVFKGKEFADWLFERVPGKEPIANIPVVVIPKGTPAIAIPSRDETPEDWANAAAETESMLKNAEKAFKTVDEFLDYLGREMGDLKRKVGEYGPGGAKHLLKSGEPHSMAKKVPKWEAQLGAYESKFLATKAKLAAAEEKLSEAAGSYRVAPVTTVAFEEKAQDSLADILEFILDMTDLEKQKTLLAKFKENLAKQKEKSAASLVVTADESVVGDYLLSLWDSLVGYWDSVLEWAKGLTSAVDSFQKLAQTGNQNAE